MISQHWLRQWIGAVRQQAIAWSNIDQDLWFHVVSVGYNGTEWVNQYLFVTTLSCLLFTTVLKHLIIWRLPGMYLQILNFNYDYQHLSSWIYVSGRLILSCYLYVTIINSLAPRRCNCNLELAISKITPSWNILKIFCEIALRWMPQELTDY